MQSANGRLAVNSTRAKYRCKAIQGRALLRQQVHSYVAGAHGISDRWDVGEGSWGEGDLTVFFKRDLGLFYTRPSASTGRKR